MGITEESVNRQNLFEQYIFSTFGCNKIVHFKKDLSVDIIKRYFLKYSHFERTQKSAETLQET